MKKSTLFGLTAGLALMAGSAYAVNESEGVVPVFNPAPFTTVEDLQGIEVDFYNVEVDFYHYDVDGEGQVPGATLTNLSTGYIWECWEPDQNVYRQMMTNLNGGTSWDFIFTQQGFDLPSEAINQAGTYELVLRNMYANGDPDTPIAWSAVTYKIDTTFWLLPEEGSCFPYGIIAPYNAPENSIGIEFNNPDVLYYENNRTAIATLVNQETGEIYYCYEPDFNPFAMTNGVIYNFVFENEDGEVVDITEAGLYKLYLRGFYYENEYGEIVDIEFDEEGYDYYIKTPFIYNIWPEVAPHIVSVIPYIHIVFPYQSNIILSTEYRDGFYGDYWWNWANTTVQLYNATTGTYYPLESIEPDLSFANSGACAYYIYFQTGADSNAIQEEGEYQLQIYGVSYTNSDDEEWWYAYEGIDGQWYYYTIYEEIIIDRDAANDTPDFNNPDFSTGVDAIDGVDAYNVYNMTGVKVLNNGSAADVKNLAKGMYIVNGKKVVVR